VASVAIDELRPGAADELLRLYEAHSKWLRRYCARQLRSQDDAEDAVQTTFMHALRALRRGVTPECESAWLTTIARNVCHSQRRSRNRASAIAVDVDLERIALARPEPDEAELLGGLREALASLPENQRRALLLREWQGVPPREIADELHLSAPATHALLSRARRSLARALMSPQRPLAGLNLATLVSQLRAYAKVLFGGASAKAALVTMTAGVAVGGVSLAASSSDDPSGREEAPTRVVTVPGHHDSASSSPIARSRERARTPGRADAGTPASSRPESRAVPVASGTERALVPDLTVPDAPVARGLDEPTSPPPKEEVPTKLPVPIELPSADEVVPPPLSFPLPELPVPSLYVPAVEPPELPPLPDPGLPQLP
jgi:RNA polymerase sigma factor (sigma-70 family)